MIFSNNKKQYGVIHADPPWLFKNYSQKGTGRNALSHYDCLTFDELRRLPIKELGAKDCVLFLWAVDPLLPKAFELLNAWEFEFKTVGFYWAKTNKSANQSALKHDDFFTGLGYWTRANVEQCLLATRGKPPREAKDVRRLIVEPRREHSRKPEQVYDRIRRLAKGPYLDLFARQTRKGWDSWGHQSGLFDAGPVQTRRQPSDLRGIQEQARL